MVAGDIHVADLLDTEMDSMVRSHHLNKPVWSPVIGEQFVLEKEPAASNPHDEFAVVVIKNSQIVAAFHQKTIFTGHMVFYNPEELCCTHLLY